MLLCVDAWSDFDMAANAFSKGPDRQSVTQLKGFFEQHEVTICETGTTVFETAYQVTRALAREKYHLALKMGLGIAYHPEIAVGSAVNIIKEKPGDFGRIQNQQWQDIYALGRLDAEAVPHFKGGFINMNNSYLNVFLEYRKVVGVTVNTFGASALAEQRRQLYKADVESTNGLGFVYPCLYERQPFYHVLTIQENLATGAVAEQGAKEQLNLYLIEILQRI